MGRRVCAVKDHPIAALGLKVGCRRRFRLERIGVKLDLGEIVKPIPFALRKILGIPGRKPVCR